MRANFWFLRSTDRMGAVDEPTSIPVLVNNPSVAPGEAPAPFGNGLVRFAANVRPLLFVATKGVEPAKPACKGLAWISIWCGAMKMPKPPRTTVFAFAA